MKALSLLLKRVDSLLHPPLLGMDISDRSMKYVQFRRQREAVSFARFGEIEIPEGIIDGGEIQKEEELIRILDSWRRKEIRSGSVSVAASLPEEKGFMRLIQLPKVKREEVGSAVKWEIEANIPLPLEELHYDFEIIEPLEGDLEHFDVLISACPKTIVESYVRALHGSGLEPQTLELEAQAVVRALIKEPRTPTAYLIVDIGRTRTGLVIFAGGAIIFTTTVDFGGDTFEENIARAMGVSKEKARSLKKESGLDKRALGGGVFAALMPSVSALADEAKRALGYYRNHASHRHGANADVGAMLLCGGDANLAGLDTYLASSLRIPVKRADSFAAVRDRLYEPVPPLAKDKSLAYVSAVGLALYGLQNNHA